MEHFAVYFNDELMTPNPISEQAAEDFAVHASAIGIKDVYVVDLNEVDE